MRHSLPHSKHRPVHPLWLLLGFALPLSALPPVANPSSYSLEANASHPLQLTGSDPESAPLIFQLTTPPTHGTLSGSVPDLVYTPNPHFRGSDSLQFTVSDGTETSTAATVSFVVGQDFSGGTLSADTVLGPGPIPYGITSDLIVPENIRLTCLEGTILQMQSGCQIRVRGRLLVEGSPSMPVQFLGAPGMQWGALSFENPSGASSLHHFRIQNATAGLSPLDSPDRYPAAISSFKATLTVENLDLDACQTPISSREGNLTLRSGVLRCGLGTDFVSVKQGTALIENCTFYGSGKSDSDGVDFNGVQNGSILNNRFLDFRGNNSDAIDIGEASANIAIEGNRIFFSADKGVSIGQGSSAILRRNLFAGCSMGVGIKDSGSFGNLDQNTFAACGVGVAVYEKNGGAGAGSAQIQNCVFGASAVAPVTTDNLGQVSASYCLSDTVPVPGTLNLVAPVPFIAPQRLDFSLPISSAAHDAGNPLHPTDPDGSRADLGALVVFDPADYPLPLPVAISEISPDSPAGDWIELHNRSSSPVTLDGYFLSDDKDFPFKYAIPNGITIAPDAYRVFSDSLTFGSAFHLNPTGESVYLTSPTGARFKASYGPTPYAKSQGIRYAVPVVETEFVLQDRPTPMAPNSGPHIPEIVFSEILPRSNQSGLRDEFIELWNRSPDPIRLADSTLRRGWRITGGIVHAFPDSPALTLASGERMVLAKDPAAFRASFGSFLPKGTRVFEWTQGSLSNSGDSLILEKPVSLTTYSAVDSVTFSNGFPQPVTSATRSLVRTVSPQFINWSADTASPGSLKLVSFTFNPPPVLTGKTSPALFPTGLRPYGEKLVLKALPATGHIFSHWSVSGQTSLSNPLTLFLNEPLTLSTEIIPFPFTSGSFFGALSGTDTTGTWKVALSASGTLSGTILLNGRSYAFKGALDARGAFSLTLPRNAGQIQLQQDLGTGELSGTFTQGTTVTTFESLKLPVFSRTNPCPLAGIHNLILQPENPAPTPAPPSSTGCLTMTVSSFGACKVVGGLGDGTSVSFSLPLGDGNRLAIGVLLPKKGGTLNGSLQFLATTPETLSGSIQWQRLPDPTLPWAEGFSSLLTAAGCRWTPPISGARIIPALDAATGSNGAATFTLSNSLADLTTSVLFSSKHVAKENTVTDLRPTISVSASTGIVSGSFHPPGTSSTTRYGFRGVFLPVQGFAQGYAPNKLVPVSPFKMEIRPPSP